MVLVFEKYASFYRFQISKKLPKESLFGRKGHLNPKMMTMPGLRPQGRGGHREVVAERNVDCPHIKAIQYTRCDQKVR